MAVGGRGGEGRRRRRRIREAGKVLYKEKVRSSKFYGSQGANRISRLDREKLRETALLIRSAFSFTCDICEPLIALSASLPSFSLILLRSRAISFPVHTSTLKAGSSR
jgi:hypothetical protein